MFKIKIMLHKMKVDNLGIFGLFFGLILCHEQMSPACINESA